MVSIKVSSQIKDSYSFRVAKKSDIDDMINIIDDFYEILKIKNAPLDKNKAPWSWINHNDLSFKILLIDNKVCGFFIARYIEKNSHLHSIFIKKNYRGNGFGEILLREHWRNAICFNPNMQTLTLHIHKKNIKASEFYLKQSYKKISQDPLLIYENDGFGKWAQNCNKKDQWPLRKGIDLYGIRRKDVERILSISG